MDTRIERQAFNDVLALLGAITTACVGLALWVGSPEPAMAFHGALFCLAAAPARRLQPAE